MVSYTQVIVLLSLIVASSKGVEASCDPSDSGALLEFASAFNDSGKILSSWVPNTDCCSWLGVNCSASGRVQGLSVEGPEVKSGLPLVRKVDFGGSVGGSLGRLAALESISLVDVYFNTLAPWAIGQLWPTLTDLLLIRCNFTGGIPFSWGYLSNLQNLVLAETSFTGAVPGELCNLAKIVTFDLGGNQLTGPFPTCTINLKNVQTIRLDENQLSGPLPNEIGFLSPTLDFLALSGNQFTGPIPVMISKLTKLRLLLLNRNQLSGPIPPEISLMKGLEALILDHNPLTGTIPPGLANLQRLVSLYMTNCSLSGVIPANFGNLANLSILKLNNNSLTGTLPPSLGYVPAKNRLEIDVTFNKLSGAIPDSLYNVMTFNASYNFFTGAFPLSLAGGKFVEVSGNQLTRFAEGNIPDHVSPLQYLKLDRNNITGQIPLWFRSLNSLSFVELSQNQISGGVPATFLAQENLKFVNFSNNQLSGELSSFPSRSLVVLDLHKNQILGGIPEDYISNLPSLKYLDLSYNKLTRTVPANLVSSGLTFLNLVGNSLCSCGDVPRIP